MHLKLESPTGISAPPMDNPVGAESDDPKESVAPLTVASAAGAAAAAPAASVVPLTTRKVRIAFS